MTLDLEATSPADGATETAPRLLHETVVDRLRDMIVHGELEAGTKLNERVLCESLGTSRTPLREALNIAGSRVDVKPRHGFTPRAARASFRLHRARAKQESL